MTEDMITSYEGQLINLRPLMAEDVRETIKWRNKPALRDKVLGYRFPVTLPMEHAWYQRVLAGEKESGVYFGIVDKNTAQFIGFVSLTEIDWVSRHSELGIVIGEERFQGKGLGLEAVRLCLSYAFDCLNLEKVWLKVAEFNQAACAMFLKAGFSQDGLMRRHVFIKKQYHDVIIMSTLASEYSSLSK